MRSPKCKLCLKEAQLVKKSHIILDFMYEHVWDENHFAITRRITEQNQIRKGKVPTGEYEGNILCLKCEREVLGQYESYA